MPETYLKNKFEIFAGILLDSGGMEKKIFLHLMILFLGILSVSVVKAEDPYKFFTWTVTYGTASPLGVPQQVFDYLFLILFLVFDFGFNLVFISCYFCLCMFEYLQVILIIGQFPGPRLDVITNDNIILNLINKLDQPFLLTW